MSVPSDRERLVRLETRAKEADVALKQLKNYVQLLKQKAAGSSESAGQEVECRNVEEENNQLSVQVTQLKQILVELEIRNGIEQVPPNTRPSQPLTSQANVIINGTSISTNQPPETDIREANSKEIASRGKKKGGSSEGDGGKVKKDKKPSEGGGGGGASTTVDVSRLDFKIGRILSVERHPDADSLYVEKIDLGEDKPRTVCSGLVAHVSMDAMNNRLVVILCNLKPVKMRGIVSEAMVMCASSPDEVEILDPPDTCLPGERITFEGYTGQPDAQLNPKKKVFEQIQPDFLVNEEGVATYRGIPFTVPSKGVCRAATMRGTGIK